MRRILTGKVAGAITRAHAQGELCFADKPAGLTVEVPNVASHGDWATNAALVMAKAEKKAPRDLAAVLIKYIEDPDGYLERVEIAGPGFINFTLSPKWWRTVLREAVRRGPEYGRTDIGQGQRVQVEFVSANPTGPLSVAHGRQAALGDVLANIMEFIGFDVSALHDSLGSGTVFSVSSVRVLSSKG